MEIGSSSTSSPADSQARDLRPPLTLWENISFSITHGAVAGLLAVLGLRGLYRFGRLFGTIEWVINYKRRGRFRRALKRVMPEPPVPAMRRRFTRDHFITTRCDKLFYLAFDRLPREQAIGLFSITNQELLDRSLERGNGVYIAMSHHGPHHVGAMLMALRGYQVAGVRDRREGGIRRYVQYRFDRLYPEFQRMRVLYSDSYPRDIFRCFQDGFVLGSAMDISRVRRAGQRMETVEIFGEQRPFLTGPLRVALKCRAPVIQGFLLPEAGFHYRLDLTEMLLDPEKVGDAEEALKSALIRYAGNVERYVQAYPSLLSRL